MDMRLEEHFESSSTLQRNERVKSLHSLAALMALSNASASNRAIILAALAIVSAILSNFAWYHPMFWESSVGFLENSPPAGNIFRNGA
jgi:hypothetical protein